MKNLLHCKKFDYRKEQEKRLKKKRKGFSRVDAAYIIFFYFMLCSFCIGIKNNVIFPFQTVHAQTLYISPLARLTSPTPTSTPTPQLTSQQEQMQAIIRETFGKYTDKAMQLLSCENSALNPDAINTAGNTPSDSMDIGLFQINNYWNDIGNVELLKDPRVNTAVAWHKFVASGYSFNQWTCGRKLGL